MTGAEYFGMQSHRGIWVIDVLLYILYSRVLLNVDVRQSREYTGCAMYINKFMPFLRLVPLLESIMFSTIDGDKK